MASNIKVQLLRDFSVLGKRYAVIKVNKKYAHDYLIPKGIANEILTAHDLKEDESQQNTLSERNLSVTVFSKKSGVHTYIARRITERPPEEKLRICIGINADPERISWEWLPANKLSFLPYGERYVIINFRKQKYLATFNYLKKLPVRKIKAPIVVDGSNLGWYKGFPEMESVFSLFSYLANDSAQFFFPVFWVFDRSFRRKLGDADKRVFDEFKNWAGVKIVDYADREIFRTARKVSTRFIFSNDHFKEFFKGDFFRISFY